MVRLLHVVAAIILACVGLHAQDKPTAKPSPGTPPAAAKPEPAPTPTPAPALPPGVTISEAWPTPPDLHGKLRDLQFQRDQLEIQNLTLQVQIEQNKVKERDLMDQFRSMAFDFAVAQKIDLVVNEFDYGELKFSKKKPKVLSLGK